MPMDRRRRLCLASAAFLSFLFAFQIALFPARAGNDVWWHLKTGEYLSTTGPLWPEHDVFSATGADREWVNHEWASDILMYWAYVATGGIMGLVALKAAFFGVTCAFLFWLGWKRGGNVGVALLLALLAAWASQHWLVERPPLFTNFFLLAFLALLQRGWERGWSVKSAILTALLVAVWGNLHGGVILALVSTAAYAGPALLRRTWDSRIVPWAVGICIVIAAWFVRPHGMPSVVSAGIGGYLLCMMLPSKPWRAWVLFPLLVLGAVCANPWGWRVLELTFKVNRDWVLTGLIFELLPPEYRFYKLTLVWVAVSLVILAVGFRRERLPESLFLAFMLWQASRHVRHTTLAALVLAWVVAGAWPVFAERVEKHWRLWQSPRAPRVATIAVAAITALSLAFGMRLMAETRTRPYFMFDGCVEAAYPVELCDFLLKTRPPGPMLNGDVGYAGYLIWRLSPESYKVWTDSRFDIHGSGPARMLSSVKAASDEFTVAWARDVGNPVLGPAPDDQPYWRAIIDWLDPGFIIVSTEDYNFHILDRRLAERGSGWARVFVSPARRALYASGWAPWQFRGYAIYVRDTEANRALIERLRAAWLEERDTWN